MGIALLAPEFLVFCAYCQFSEARKLVKDLNELRAAQGEAEGFLAKTQGGSTEPAEGARHPQQNLQSSMLDAEKGQVWIAYRAFGDMPKLHRISGRVHILRDSP